jgi:hypothetical protein
MPAFILPFITRFGPWIILAIVLVGVYAVGNSIVSQWHDGLIKEGREIERSVNFKATQDLAAALVTANARAEVTSQKLRGVVAEQGARSNRTVVDALRNRPRNPACFVPPVVTQTRNDIRTSRGPAENNGGEM